MNLLFDEHMITYQTINYVPAVREVYNIAKGTLRLPDTACVWLPRRMAVIMEMLCLRGKDEFITCDAIAAGLWGSPERWKPGWQATTITYISNIRQVLRNAGLTTKIRCRYEWGYHLEPMPLVEP